MESLLVDLSREFGRLAKEQSLTFCTVESCTGGLIGGTITAVSGSSDYYLGGLITYSNEAKNQLVNVPQETLETHGAVSEQTARAMAQGGRTVFSCDGAIAVTGLAGPSGATEGKPIGRVWITVLVGQQENTTCYHFRGDREEIRKQTIVAALNKSIQMMKEVSNG